MRRFGGWKLLVRVCLPALIAGVAILPASAAGAATPTLSVTPSKNLADLQSVTVAGKGFTPSVTIGIVECASTATGEAGCDLGTLVETTDSSSGAFSISRYVRRIIHPSSGQLDCASKPGACAMAAADVSNIAEHAGALLSFNPKIPPAIPKATTTPSTGLRDHQTVQVTGSGMQPNGFAEVLQCKAGGTPSFNNCDPSTARQITIGPDGKFTTSWVVHRILDFTIGSPTIQTLDCASKPGACVADVIQSFGPSGQEYASDHLSFNPTIPPVPQRLAVTPTVGLVDHQLIQLEGGGFSAGSSVSVEQCEAGGVLQEFCDYSTSVSVAAGFLGHFHLVYAVQRIILAAGVPFDCASKPGACVLIATNNQRPSESASQRLSFNPSVPPVVATITVTPHTNLYDDELVTISGKGFVPFSTVAVSQCSSEALGDPYPSGYCSNGFGPLTTANRVGAITITLFVHRVIVTQPGPVACASKAGACLVAAFRTNGLPFPETGILASVPLTFRR